MKYKLFILTILGSVGFYNYHGMVSDQITKAVFYVSVFLCFLVAMRDGISLRNVNYPRTAYVVLIAGILFSAIMATSFHSQGLIVSFTALLPFLLAYVYFYVLLKFNIPREKIMKAYLVFCGIATIVYFCNLATAPHNMFGKPIIGEDLTRGIIRVPIPFLEAFPLIVFYGINKWIDTKQKKWIVVIAVASLVIFLSVVRQIIGLTAVLSLWFFFRRVSVWKKLSLILVTLMVVVFVLPQIPIYNTMMELSEKQRDDNQDKENIRITAWRYYTYENQTNAVTPWFGNGVPSYNGSLWGKMFESETEVASCYAADVGWAGFFWYFGLFSTLALLYLMVRAILTNKGPDCEYLKYYLLFIIATSVASGPIIYFWQILNIVACLSMIYQPDDGVTDKKEEDEEDSTDNIELQQLPRYPQLH